MSVMKSLSKLVKLSCGPVSISCQSLQSSRVLPASRMQQKRLKSSAVAGSGNDFTSLPKNSTTRPYTIVVEGNIGSGKTTFLQPFTTIPQVEVLEEPVKEWRSLDNGRHNLLELMYTDPTRWSLLFQTYVQLTMLRQHSKPAIKPVRIMERSLLSARYCFVENLHERGQMTEAEYAVLSEWFNFLVTCPNLDFGIDHIIYLRTDPEVAYERVKKRRRHEEHLIPIEYIRDLHNLHEDWLFRRTKFQPLQAPVTVVDANQDLEAVKEECLRLEENLIKSAIAKAKS